MRALCVLLVLALSLVVAAGKSVVPLTTADFDDITRTGSWLVDFYAPWCGHCKQLEPVLEEVAVAIDDLPIGLAKVDCTLERELQTRFNVKSYPTLLFFRDGEHRQYRGERTKVDFVNFAKAVSAPPVLQVRKKGLDRAKEENAVTFLFLGEQGPEYRVYEAVARKYQGLAAFLSSDSARVKELAAEEISGGHNTEEVQRALATGRPMIVWITQGDADVFTGPFTSSGLGTWVFERKLPLLSELGPSNFYEITESGKLAVLAVIDPARDISKPYLDMIRRLARDYRNKFVFANIDGVKHSKYVEQFGLAPSNFPVVFAFDYPKEQYYPPPATLRVLSAQNVTIFLDMVYEGKIQPFGIGPWWSPGRILKWLERWIDQFSELELAAISGAIMLVMMIVIFWLFCTGPSSLLNTPPPPDVMAELAGLPPGAAAAAAAAAGAGTGQQQAEQPALRQRPKPKLLQTSPKIQEDE